MLKNVWRDPVWSKVIAGIILAIAAAIGSYFLDWWPPIWKSMGGALTFAASSTPIPNWIISLLILLALPVILLVGALIWQWAKPSSLSPSWRHYTSDIFFAIKWRWSYFDDGQIGDLHSFCTACDYQVFPQDVSSFRAVDHIAFRCDSCGRRLAEFEESVGVLESKVKRFIQQKIRNGTWAVPNRA